MKHWAKMGQAKKNKFEFLSRLFTIPQKCFGCPSDPHNISSSLLTQKKLDPFFFQGDKLHYNLGKNWSNKAVQRKINVPGNIHD